MGTWGSHEGTPTNMAHMLWATEWGIMIRETETANTLSDRYKVGYYLTLIFSLESVTEEYKFTCIFKEPVWIETV